LSTASHRVPLGQLLVDAGLLTPDALAAVLREQQADGRRLGEILVARGLVSNTQLTQILSHQLSLPWVSLAKVNVDPELLALVPRELVARYVIVPVYVRQDGARAILYVATDDPTDEVALRECAAHAGMDVRPMVAASDDLRAAIDAWYSGGAREAPAVVSEPSRHPTAGAMRVVASVYPTADAVSAIAVSKPPRLPSRATADVELVDDADLELLEDEMVAVAPAQASPLSSPDVGPVVLVVSPPKKFARTCRFACEAIGARVETCDLAKASHRARELSPFALVVTEDVYAFDRLGLSKLALDVDALLVVWSDDLEASYLEPLLDTAQKRSRARISLGSTSAPRRLPG